MDAHELKTLFSDKLRLVKKKKEYFLDYNHVIAMPKKHLY